jgi:hypothetical protein
MATNAFDDLPPANAVAANLSAAASAASATPANAFDDLTPRPQSKDLPPVTASNRMHAAESGVFGGTAYLLSALPDAAANAYNLGKAALGTGLNLATSGSTQDPIETPGNAYRYHYIAPDGSEHYSKNPPPEGSSPVTMQHPGTLLDVSGPSPVGHWLTDQMDKSPLTSTQLERPDDAASRWLAAGGSVIPGAVAGGGGAVAPTVKALAGALPAAAAGQTVMEAHPFQSEDANRTAAMLTQALTSVGTPYATKAVIRGVNPTPTGIVTGAAPDVMGENIAAFNSAGADPSLAQAAGTRRMQFLESGVSKIPGGAGVLQKAAEQQAKALRGGVDATVDQMAPGGASPERAGRAITQGVTGPGGFRDQFNTKAETLYGAVDQYIPPDSPVDVSNTLATLDRVAKPNPLAPKTTAALINPKVASIRGALQEDLGPNGTALPYSTLSDLRSRVGSMLTGSELVTDIPRAQVKQLYGALSDDLRGAAQAAGPDAVQAFSRASNYYRAGMARMDTLSDVLDKSGGPEQVFNGAMSGTKDGATRLRSIMQSLEPEQQQVVASTVFKRMGQASAGNQNAAGDVFSPETFLTNYNKMSPEAKSALFDRFPDLRAHADNLAEVAGNLRDGSKVFRNVSGTAGAENQTHTLRDLLIGTLMGGGGAAAGAEGYHHLGAPGLALAGGALGVPVAAHIGARAITSPAVLNWAARPAVGSSAQAAALTAAPANLNAKDKQQLINALGVVSRSN